MKKIEFESAQNVKIEYELAPVSARTAAAAIDFLLFSIYFIVFGATFGFVDFLQDNIGTFLLLQFLLMRLPWVLYNPIIEFLTNGQSLGKYILGIRVVTVNGERPGLREVFTRWLFKGDFLWITPDLFAIFWFGIGLMGIMFAGTSSRTQRIGDVMANTVVIKNKSSVNYSLTDVLSIKNKENHTPTYPQAIVFTDEDMLLIKTTINRLRRKPNEQLREFAIELADESARILGLEKTPEKRLKFLKTLLQDYVVLTR